VIQSVVCGVCGMISDQYSTHNHKFTIVTTTERLGDDLVALSSVIQSVVCGVCGVISDQYSTHNHKFTIVTTTEPNYVIRSV
jgi:Asp/Glu/hydantoin racemase